MQKRVQMEKERLARVEEEAKSLAEKKASVEAMVREREQEMLHQQYLLEKQAILLGQKRQRATILSKGPERIEFD
jgi:hypothetical protein